MKIEIEGTPEELAALVIAIQERPERTLKLEQEFIPVDSLGMCIGRTGCN